MRDELPTSVVTTIIKDVDLAGDDLPPGMQMGQFLLEKKLGEGGCAQVYRARNPQTGQLAAIKVLKREFAGSFEMVQRFMREVKVVTHLQNPHIVNVIANDFLEDGRPFFVMELIDGMSLREVMRKKGRFTPEETLEYLEPICSALAAAHVEGIVHRDVKAANVMVSYIDGKPQVKLLDFGIAKLLRPEPGEVGLTTEFHRLGTSSSMAPEQITGGPIDARTDIYGVGVMVHEMLTGCRAFDAPTVTELEQMHLTARPPMPSDFSPVSSAVDGAVIKCLEKKKDLRFQSIQDFMNAYRAAALANRPAEHQSSMGVGIHAEYTWEDNGDEAMWELVPAWLEGIEALLQAAAYVPVLQTASSVLYVKAVDGNNVEVEKKNAVELQQRLNKVGQESAQGHVCQFVVRWNVGSVEKSGTEFVGGALLNLETWS